MCVLVCCLRLRDGRGEGYESGEEEELGLHDARLVDIDRVFPSED